jgi:ketosteroid isomerase-like protein
MLAARPDDMPLICYGVARAHRMKGRPMTDEQTRQLLLDRTEISDVVYRYATSIDQRDANLLATVFADEVTVLLRGGSFKDGRTQTLPGSQFAQSVIKSISRFASTQHLFNVYKIELKGDEAQTLVYMQARHFIRESEGVHPPWDMGGNYVHHLVRTASGWKVNVAPRPAR